MRFLLDTNIWIPAEPTRAADVEPTTSAIVRLLRLVAEGQHAALIHPASLREVGGDQDSRRRETRTLLLGKYAQVQHPPPASTRLTSVLGVPRPGSHNEVDLLLLSSVEGDAVDYFVTEDDGIHRRAGRVGLGHRVLTVADAILAIQALFPSVPQPPPLVESVLVHQLNDADPIFVSFRHDYPPFDEWLTKCKRLQRQAWVIGGASGYAGVCIIKEELTTEHGFTGKQLKICSFKIADEFRGYRYGELLLKTVFAYVLRGAPITRLLPKKTADSCARSEHWVATVLATSRG